jgi:predicted amidohydrolase
MFKLGLIQMCVAAGHKQENVRHAVDLIRQAARQGATVAVLPEAMPLGWTDPSALAEADSIPDGYSCLALREVARETGIYVCSGLVERSGQSIYNAAVLIGPTGEVLLHHRKLNELEIGHPFYSLGDRLQVARTPLGTMGLMICADAFARDQVIGRALGYLGAAVILSPSSWAVPAEHDNQNEPYGQLWLDNYCPVARDFRLWIAGVSNVGWITGGPWRGRKCIGCSLIVGPTGQQVLMGPYGAEAETILYADIDPMPRPAQGDGWQKLWAATPLTD